MCFKFASCFLRFVVNKVGEVITCYETDASFARLEEKDFIFIPKLYLMYRVRSIDLEMVWTRLPKAYQDDEELLVCRPCLKHYSVEEACDIHSGIPRRKDCTLCVYNAL